MVNKLNKDLSLNNQTDLNKEILDKVDEIIEVIKTSSDYQKYLSLQEKMNNNQELMKLINEVKTLQKALVNGKDKKNELKEKMSLLENNPMYREYNNTLSEINNKFAIIENTLNNYFEKKFNEE